jgi:glycosyltransferase involved in cell wall biosynthesis
MRSGGAERVMSRLLAHLASHHDVILVTWESPEVAPFYDLPQAVRLIQKDLLGGRGLRRLWRVITRVPILRREVQLFGADVVLSFMNTMNLTTIVACRPIGVGIVVSERTDPSRDSGGWAVIAARRILYPFAHTTVVQTRRIAAYFGQRARSRIAVIANPIYPSASRAVPGKPGPDGRFRVIGVGRLDYEKRFDLLISAFARVAPLQPLWDLAIFGEGPYRQRLIDISVNLGVADRVKLAGVTREPEHELAQSHIFAIPSDYEGFPNALGEAMATGLPAVGNDEVSGVEDLILDGMTGFLVGDGREQTTLPGALERMMADADLRTRMGEAALLRSEMWSPNRVLPQWESVLEAAAAEAGRPRNTRLNYTQRAEAQG